MDKIIGGVLVAFLAFVILAVAFALIGLIAAIPLYFLWNWLMPTIFNIAEITYFQAWGLFWLCSLMFKCSVSSNSDD